jgi:hypothetical protein
MTKWEHHRLDTARRRAEAEQRKTLATRRITLQHNDDG